VCSSPLEFRSNKSKNKPPDAVPERREEAKPDSGSWFFGLNQSSQHIGKTFPHGELRKLALHKSADQQLLLTCHTKPHSGTGTGLQISQSGIPGSHEGLSNDRCPCSFETQIEQKASEENLPSVTLANHKVLSKIPKRYRKFFQELGAGKEKETSSRLGVFLFYKLKFRTPALV